MSSLWKRCLLGVLSALLLNLPFPIAGPVSAWRTAFAFVGAVPLLYALLAPSSVKAHHYLLRSFLVGWVTGVVWYGFNCYWIYQTMYFYGRLPSSVSAGILILYSLILGLYFALFAWSIAWARQSFGSTVALVLTPFAWVASDLLASLVTKVPWDQLGYSQVGNFILTSIAPFTGVYGVTFVLLCVNVIFVLGLICSPLPWRVGYCAAGVALVAVLQSGCWMTPKAAPTQATAVLLQENLSVTHNNSWLGAEWGQNASAYLDASARTCSPFIAGMPETSARVILPQCVTPAVLPDIVAWPEAPSPFRNIDPRFQQLMKTLTGITHSPVIVGNFAIDFNPDSEPSYYNAAITRFTWCRGASMFRSKTSSPLQVT
jgi:apolipoprotein N-acyltransferase